MAEYVPVKPQFEVLDWIVLSVYLAGVFSIGFISFFYSKRKKQTSTSSFFTGGGKTPGWVIGVSIWATTLSSLTYIATPGLAFQTGWMWSFSQLTILFVTPIVIKWVIPFFRRMKENTAYAYIGLRFHKSIRFISSASFIIFHLFRIGIVLYIPIQALTLFIPINTYALIAIVGAVVVISTLAGGMKAVLWTDAIQGIVLLSGIFLILIFGLVNTDFNSPSFQYHTAFNNNSINVTALSGGIFFIFISNYVSTLYQYIGSQDVVQRYKSNNELRKTNRSLWINFGLVAIAILLFYGAGSVLYSYYSSQGANITFGDKENTSHIVGDIVKNPRDNLLIPYFIVTVLPMGISGLVIAAILAASQSTISSSLSALSNAVIVDFVQVIFPKWKDKSKDKQLKNISLILVGIAGAIGIGIAMWFTASGQANFIQYFLAIISLLGGPVVAIFILGIFTKRTNWVSALIGITLGLGVGFIFWIMTQDFIDKNVKWKIDSVIWGPLPFIISLLFGYGSAAIMGLTKLNKKIKIPETINLSIWTVSQEFKDLIRLEKFVEKLKTKEKKPNFDKLYYEKSLEDFERLKKVVDLQMDTNYS